MAPFNHLMHLVSNNQQLFFMAQLAQLEAPLAPDISDGGMESKAGAAVAPCSTRRPNLVISVFRFWMVSLARCSFS